MLEGIFWLALAALATLLLTELRDTLDKAHAAIAYLLIVLGGSSRLGRGWGVVLAVLCFLGFNFFLVEPYYALTVAHPLDWLILLGFLITGVVAAHLLYRAQSEAAAARARAEEIDRFAVLGAETLSLGPADEAVAAIARAIRERLGLRGCGVFERTGASLRLVARAHDESAPPPSAGDPELMAQVAEDGRAVVIRPDGGIRRAPASEPLAELLGVEDALEHILPLRVRGESVGVLHFTGHGPIHLAPPERRFAETLAYYAALGVERLRLAAQAERAEALREADHLKDALLASVSHDLRTPLTTIKALAHQIRTTGDADAAINADAAIIEEEADRLNRFVSDLLDLSRLEAEAVRPRAELVPADELLGAALQQAEAVCGQRVLQVHMPPADEIPIARIDFVLALRALVNLIGNACKYAPPDAPVELTVTRLGDAVVVRVDDRGPGVPEADRERIFEPFFRGQARGHAAGTGLGLSIARRLAHAQGGDVTFAPRPGGGSTFTLSLPAAALTEAPGEAEQRGMPGADERRSQPPAGRP